MNAKKSKKRVQLNQELGVGSALAEILSHNLKALEQWEATARSWEDIEGVHQMRVASRRMRAALSAFRGAVPKELSAPWSQELGWIAGELGRARDLDVFIDEGLGAVVDRLPLAGGDRLIALAETHRAEAYEAVRAMLDSDRYARFKNGFARWVETQAWNQPDLPSKQRRTLDEGISVYSRRLLDRLERKVLEAGSEVDKNDAAQMHRLRIECKKLRYAAEFFAPVLPGLDGFIAHLKGLQDLLGVLNDVSVMGGLLDALLEGQSDPELIRFSGALVGWRTREAYQLLDGFDERWEAFVHAKHPWWHKGGKPAD